ncbi:MAG: uracil-DNA glycosylase [Acidobacteriota bacterium]
MGVESGCHVKGHGRLQRDIVACCRCPRLVSHRERVAREKRRAFRQDVYWGKPVPSLGLPQAHLLIVGLAPGAHGANRTGRMFTGDSSGDFLYGTLHRFGFSNQPTSVGREDGLELRNTYITAAIHCVPPKNKPTVEELATCGSYLVAELQLLKRVKVVVALGGIAWRAYLRARRELGWDLPRPLPRFGHGTVHRFGDCTVLIGSYHPSRQNTQTGRLTEEMFDHVFNQARRCLVSESGTVVD